MLEVEQRQIAELQAQNAELRRQLAEHARLEEQLADRERRWRTILDSEPECVKTLSADGMLIEMNPAGLVMIEADSLAQVAGHCVYQLVVPEFQPAFRRLVERVFQGESGTLEFEVIGLKGTRRWLETRAAPLRNESGQVTSLLGVTRDVTERRRSEAALRESEQKYRELFELASDAILISDSHGRFLDANPAGCEMFGYSLEEFRGLNVADIVVPEEFSRIAQEIARLGGGTPIRAEWRCRRKDWTSFYCEVTSKQLPDGRLQGFGHDITHRKLADIALRESEEKFRALANYSLMGIGLLVPDRVVYANPELCRMVGRTAEELAEMGMPERLNLIHPDDRPRAMAEQARFLNGELASPITEYRLLKPNGDVVWVLGSAKALVLQGQQTALVMFVDITERKLAESALRESQAMLELVLDSIPQGVFWKDRDSVYRGANRVSRRAMGCENVRNVIGRTDFDIPHFQREQATFFVQKDRDIMQSGRPEFGIVETMTLPDGATIWLETNKLPMRDAAGNVTGVLGTWEDITERKRASEELAASRERLATLSRQLIETQEAERRNLARELHDEIGQVLTGIRLNLQAVASQPLAPKSEATMSETVAMIDQLLQQIRGLALELRPSMLDDIGLPAALRWCLERQARLAGFTAHFVAEPAEIQASPEIAIACFRVAQESLTNIVRHAHATDVRVELYQRDGELELRVWDNGCGFAVAAARERAAKGASLGLLGMQERVELAGGRFEITSDPSEGTTILARFPTPAAESSGVAGWHVRRNVGESQKLHIPANLTRVSPGLESRSTDTGRRRLRAEKSS